LFDETALRRPEFAPGVPVRLGDGQTWEMRRPRIRWYAQRKTGKARSVATSHELGPESDDIFGVFFDDTVSADWDFPSARFELAIRLLEGNYSLTDEHYRELLWYEPGNPESKDMWDAISSVIAGATPKPTPAT
jgi:hypothetical protein